MTKYFVCHHNSRYNLDLNQVLQYLTLSQKSSQHRQVSCRYLARISLPQLPTHGRFLSPVIAAFIHDKILNIALNIHFMSYAINGKTSTNIPPV